MNILTKYTFETLKKNKGRTLVTVVGIVLSLSMLTSVMVLISSSQQYLKNSVISTYGMWHGVILDADENVKNAMISNEDIADYHYLENIGYAVNSSAGSAAKPYFFVAGADKGFFEKMPVRLTKGRLPENENEIILPEHSSPYLSALEFDGKQTITLETGQRKYGNLRLTQLDGYEPGETLEISETREFTVVGIYQKPSFESWDAAGATALTAATGENRYLMDIYYNPVNITQTYNIMDVYTGAPYFCGSLTNTTLLRFSGASAEKGYNRVLYGLGVILCAIIIFASIALI
ncbi:MAG: ABC transporter permease, partial [Oscillospiraceae bacterium]|nr:ABC transporter permease [Oscillospiraceae bacterium]